MIIIGLTGGIGTGKSTVSDYLRSKGITIVDADRIAHEITEPGQPALKKLKEVFGEDIILDGDILDRKLLAARAFSSEENTKLLEIITHGAIKDEMESQITSARVNNEKMLILDVPLLVEAGLYEMCDKVWIVTADKTVRYDRIRLRDNMSDEEIEARMNRQLSDEERNKYADEIIDNSGGKEELYNRLEELLLKYE
ncbi:MAG: dephospho-CoA kinase [Firmicutes bacterium]|nr:dephospho-CoA kinase [Bacillota bacterium]